MVIGKNGERGGSDAGPLTQHATEVHSTQVSCRRIGRSGLAKREHRRNNQRGRRSILPGENVQGNCPFAEEGRRGRP